MTAKNTVRPLTLAAALRATGLAGCAMGAGSGWTTLVDGGPGLGNFNRVGDADGVGRVRFRKVEIRSL